jgi:hypothetical protein
MNKEEIDGMKAKRMKRRMNEQKGRQEEKGRKERGIYWESTRSG